MAGARRGDAATQKQGRRSIEAVNPATSEKLGEFIVADAAAVDAAVVAAGQAAPAWRRLGPRGRRKCLRDLASAVGRRRDEIALLDARDSGNPLHAMRADVEKAIEYLEYFGEIAVEVGGRVIALEGDARVVVTHEPFGVVGVITAYNHPFYFSIVKSAAALAAGNSVVVKPPEQATLSSLLLAELAAETLPAGVFTVVPGDSTTGESLVDHPGAPRISFTGGLEAGRRVLSRGGELMKVVTIETGGKNAFVADRDVQVDAAARAAARSLNLLSVAGQSCSSTSMLLAHESIRGQLVDALRGEMEAIPLALPEEPGVHMGCLISKSHQQRVDGYVQGAVRDGARLATGGVPVERYPNGAFYPPTLVVDVSPGMAIAREEVFGPVMAVVEWKTDAELFEIVHASGYGMTANLWSPDERRARGLAGHLRVGMAWINSDGVPLPLGVPFGGVGLSGMARDHSIDELKSFTYMKAVGGY